MLDLVLALIPLSLGIVMSPLAIMALVAVLLSAQARRNGIAFLLGWAAAVVVTLGLSFLVFELVGVSERGEPPQWVSIVRIVLGATLLAGALFIYRRGRSRVVEMAQAVSPEEVVQAAPQLPGWLRAVDTFTPARSAILGFGIFALNPVDLSCAILAALDIRLASTTTAQSVIVTVAFVALAIAPIAVPVLVTLAKGDRAAPTLERLRRWIAAHTTQLNAALLVFIAVVQLHKGITGLI
ncbi:GAP family protein [Conyzicola sp.]|uniref:GAP family protein n=1 Tax=Conyzicola sp. TaxID=1969404 RepID=UPI003988DFE7